MGLRQKSRRFRLGFWEYCGFTLMVLTLFCAVAWWIARPTADWIMIPGRVIGASLVENTDPISAARPAIRIHYSYVVLGQIYTGSTILDAFARVRYRALPREVQILLSRKGYSNFNDLPPEVREILRQRGIHRLDAVPEPLLDTLRAQGFNSVQDFPTDVRDLVKAGEYDRAAHAMEQVMTGRMEEMARTGKSPDIPSVAALTEGGVVQIRYDPNEPENHYVVRLPVLEGAAGDVLLIVCSVLLIGYCGFIYPRAKEY
jgi:hypothetical protein